MNLTEITISLTELIQPEKEVLAKGLNFALVPEHIPVVDLITATESAIRNNKLADTEAEQLQMKVSATLANAKAPPFNLTTKERRTLASLRRDRNITILPAVKWKCTAILNSTDYRSD